LLHVSIILFTIKHGTNAICTSKHASLKRVDLRSLQAEMLTVNNAMSAALLLKQLSTRT